MYKPEINIDNKPLIGEPGYNEMLQERNERKALQYGIDLEMKFLQGFKVGGKKYLYDTRIAKAEAEFADGVKLDNPFRSVYPTDFYPEVDLLARVPRKIGKRRAAQLMEVFNQTTVGDFDKGINLEKAVKGFKKLRFKNK